MYYTCLITTLLIPVAIGQQCDCNRLGACAAASVEAQHRGFEACHQQCKFHLGTLLDTKLEVCQRQAKAEAAKEKDDLKELNQCTIRSVCSTSNFLLQQYALAQAQAQAQAQQGGVGRGTRTGSGILGRVKRQTQQQVLAQQPQLQQAPDFVPDPNLPTEYNAYRNCSYYCGQRKRTEPTRDPSCEPQQGCNLVRHEVIAQQLLKDCPPPTPKPCSASSIANARRQCACTRKSLRLDIKACREIRCPTQQEIQQARSAAQAAAQSGRAQG